MPLITISRGSKSGGEELALLLARKLNCNNVISREVLVKASESFGILQDELIATMDAPPRFWSRKVRAKRRNYLTFIRAALLDYAKNGSMIYHGIGGQFLLADLSWILKIRLIAPLENRIALLQKSIDLDKFEAKRAILKVDDERRRWARFLYNEEWNDPLHFDVVINLGNISLDNASDTICEIVKSPEFGRTDERVTELTNRALEAKIQAALEFNPKTREAEVEVVADGTTILLTGTIALENMRKEVIEVVSATPGITKVVDHLTFHTG